MISGRFIFEADHKHKVDSPFWYSIWDGRGHLLKLLDWLSFARVWAGLGDSSWHGFWVVSYGHFWGFLSVYVAWRYPTCVGENKVLCFCREMGSVEDFS